MKPRGGLEAQNSTPTIGFTLQPAGNVLINLLDNIYRTRKLQRGKSDNLIVALETPANKTK